MLPYLKDALLQQTLTLPNGAATTTSTAIRVHSGVQNTEFVAPCELIVEAPALAVGPLPDTQTVTYTIEGSNDNSTFVAVTGAAGLVQTGAGGAGAVAGTLRYRPPSNGYQYYRAKAVKVGAADASGSAATLSLVF